MFFGVFKNLK